MRVKIIGDTESARVLRGYLQKAGVAVSERLPKFALSCTIHLSEHSGQNIICDSIDCPLEMHILRHITELTEKDVVLRRRTGVISTENEIHLSVPTGDPESAHAVEVGVLRGVQRAHFHRPWWRRVLPTVLLVSLLAPTAWSSPRHATPQPELTSETSGGVIHISMPPGGIFPQFQTGGSSSPCSGTTAPAHTFCGNNTGSVAAPAYVSLTAADLPGSITSNTSGLAATATSFASAPSTCGAGVAAIGVLANGNATGCFTPSGLANPMTTVGDIIYGAGSGVPTRLGANSTATKQYLQSVSSGVPTWQQTNIADIGAGTSSAAYTLTGALSTTLSNGCYHINASQSFAAALVAVSTSGCLIIDPGQWTVGTNATIPVGVTLYGITNGTGAGMLSIATGVTLTINGPIVATAGITGQLFTYIGTGVVVLGAGAVGSPVYSTWFSGCAAAATAIGSSNKAILIVPGNPTFGDCTTATENITIWNLDGTRDVCNGDGGSATPPCAAINWNYDDGNVYAAERHELTTAHQDLNGVTLGLYTITHLKNATANGTSGIDGMSAEANTEGTLTGTFQALQADEADITIKSTGGAITDVRGGVFYTNIPNAGATAVTNVTGVKALGCNNINAASKPTNCIGIEVSDQTSGGVGKASGRNYSLLSRGISLFGYSSGLGAGGFDLEDATNTAKPFLRVDSSSNTILEAINSNGLLLQDSTGANQLKASSSGLQVFKDMLHAETTAPSAASGFDVCYGDSTDHMLECADNNGTFRPLRPLVLFVTSDFTTAANTNLQTITGLSWTVPARANKMNVACSLAYHQNTAAVADNWGIQAATNNPTNIFATYDAQTAATAYAGGVLATLATTTATNIGGTFTPSAITTDWTAKVNALIENAASANTFNVMIKTSVSGDALVVKRGSTCTITFQ